MKCSFVVCCGTKRELYKKIHMRKHWPMNFLNCVYFMVAFYCRAHWFFVVSFLKANEALNKSFCVPVFWLKLFIAWKILFLMLIFSALRLCHNSSLLLAERTEKMSLSFFSRRFVRWRGNVSQWWRLTCWCEMQMNQSYKKFNVIAFQTQKKFTEKKNCQWVRFLLQLFFLSSLFPFCRPRKTHNIKMIYFILWIRRLQCIYTVVRSWK